MVKRPPTDQHPDLESILARLRGSRLKITEPRKAILKALVENHGPFSAEELHARLPKKLCDVVTVYRCLTSLEGAGLVRRCEFGDGTARYELAEESDHHHHHVICKHCKRVEVLDDCELGEIDRFAQKKGFTEVSHSLEFFGVCSRCRRPAGG